MKFEHEVDVIQGSKGTTQSFTIDAGAKAFKVLSDNMYKNKIRAIIRELSCNALDSHTAVGSKQKILVRLPNAIEPLFWVQDFGLGLSHEDVMANYTTYFRSTKDQSNEFIGALGLGSKSPFSYTHTFNVISTFNGVKRGYTMMLDNGVPTCKPTFEVNTDDPNGLVVSMPVREHDFNKFTKEAQYIFQSFPIDSVDVNTNVEYIEEFNDYLITNKVCCDSSIVALYGNILYPLNRISGVDYDTINAIGGYKIIKFNLGELDIMPSREELSLDDATISKIKERIDQVSDSYINTLISDYKKLTYDRARVRHLYNLNQQFKDAVCNHLNINYDVEYKKLFSPEMLVEKLGNLNNSFYAAYVNSSSRINITTNHSYSKRNKHINSVCGVNTKKINVIYVDFDKHVNGTKNFILKNNSNINYYFMVFTQDHINTLKDIMSGDEVEIFKISDYVEEYKSTLAVRKKSSNYGRPKTPNVIKHTLNDGGYYSETAMCLTKAELKELKGLMIRTHFDHVMTDNAFEITIGTFNSLLDRLSFDERPKEYYGIKRSVDINYDCLYTHVVDLLIKKVNNSSVLNYSICTYDSSGVYREAYRWYMVKIYEVMHPSVYEATNGLKDLNLNFRIKLLHHGIGTKLNAVIEQKVEGYKTHVGKYMNDIKDKSPMLYQIIKNNTFDSSARLNPKVLSSFKELIKSELS